MSYTVFISRNHVPEDNKAAWKYFEEVNETDNGQPAQDFIDFKNKLRERHPCLCDLPEDELDEKGVWSDGPLIDNAGEKITGLGIIYSEVERVLPFVIETANNMGFVVFDGQDDSTYRPGSGKSRKGFWKTLFGK